jgi:hypothetical protein
MKRLSTPTKSRGLTTTFAAAAGAIFAAAATVVAGAQSVVITGLQVDYGDEVNPGAHFDSVLTIDDICDNADDLAFQINRALDAVDLAIVETGWAVPLSAVQNIPDMPTQADIARDVANVRTAVCNAPEPQTTAEVFTITYSSCRMAMTTATNAMVINMPTGGTSAFMLAADHATREVVHIEMTSQVDAASQFVGQGWSDQINISSLGETAEIFGYDTEHFKFSYQSGLGETSQGELGEADIQAGQINDPTRLGNLVAVQSEGTAWIAADAPGIDIVRSFYQNLTSRFQPDAGANSFFGGMISNLVGMLEKGIPIVIEQTTSSSVMGRTMISGKSESHVSNIRLRDLPPGYCERELQAPDGYQVTNMNEQMDASSAEMAAAMQEYNAAMQQMTPEQQQMMQQLGLGGMMTQPGAGTTAAQAPQAAASGSRPSGSNTPSSAELMSDNPTQTVQRHLAALGYDTGNTAGEMSLETTIAISQFQAEKGMQVTGEVTPQLIGALSAEVDRGQ